MSQLRASARLYIVALAIAAGAALSSALAHAGGTARGGATLALTFAALTALATRFPIHFAFKTKLLLDTSVVFAAVLVFDPGVAMLIAGSGKLLASVLLRRPWPETLFNGAQMTLQAGAGGAILALTGWYAGGLALDRAAHLLALPLAAVAMYAVNVLSVATIVGLQSGQPTYVVLRRTIGFDGVEHLSQLALGLLAAAVVDVHPWALPFLLLPAFAVYRSSERHVLLRKQTADAVESLADVVDIRDPYTANHSRRVAAFAQQLATGLGLSSDEVDLIERAARVHDIGKMAVEISVLTKEGKLSEEEWEQLKQHPVIGAEILASFPQFALATSYVRHHHERMDGRGYPDGIAGEAIPLGARIIAVADSFDAMSTARPYRAGLPLEVVLGEFARQRGAQWDERVVDELLRLVEAERIAVPAPVKPARARVAV